MKSKLKVRTLTALVLALVFLDAHRAFAYERKTVAGKYQQLTEEKGRLSAEYTHKQEELTALTVKIHAVDQELAELRKPPTK